MIITVRISLVYFTHPVYHQSEDPLITHHVWLSSKRGPTNYTPRLTVIKARTHWLHTTSDCHQSEDQLITLNAWLSSKRGPTAYAPHLIVIKARTHWLHTKPYCHQSEDPLITYHAWLSSKRGPTTTHSASLNQFPVEWKRVLLTLKRIKTGQSCDSPVLLHWAPKITFASGCRCI